MTIRSDRLDLQAHAPSLLDGRQIGFSLFPHVILLLTGPGWRGGFQKVDSDSGLRTRMVDIHDWPWHPALSIATNAFDDGSGQYLR